MQQASDETTPFLFGMCSSHRRLTSLKEQVRPVTSSKNAASAHVVGNIVGDALVDLEDFVALAPFLRRACPSFAKAEWLLAATTSGTRNQIRRVRFIMMISIL